MISKQKIIFLGIYTIIYIVISPIVYLITGHGLHLMLIWNIILACIPLIIMIWIQSKWVKKIWLIGVLLFFWLLFYPNSMYLISDLIYIDRSAFILTGGMYDPLIYLQNLEAYVSMFHILLGAILGIMLAVESIRPVVTYIQEKKNQIWAFGSIIVISFASSFAIYIGRFFRYNSWDILSVFRIVQDFFASFSLFTVVFIFGFAILQTLLISVLLSKK